jgi:hypothetical protein
VEVDDDELVELEDIEDNDVYHQQEDNEHPLEVGNNF